MTRARTPTDAIRACAEFYGVTEAQILSASRSKHLARARAVAMHVARLTTGLSYPELGRAFHRHHTTVLHAARSIDALQFDDPKTYFEAGAIVKRLGGYT